MARADHPESSSKPESTSKPESSSIYVGLVCTQATSCMQNLQQSCRQRLGFDDIATHLERGDVDACHSQHDTAGKKVGRHGQLRGPLASLGPLGMTTLMPGTCVKNASGDCEW